MVPAEELESILNEVDEYPVTASELADKAQKVAQDDRVVQFFESIPGETTFESEGEILSMAEQIDDPTQTVSEGTDEMDNDLV